MCRTHQDTIESERGELLIMKRGQQLLIMNWDCLGQIRAENLCKTYSQALVDL